MTDYGNPVPCQCPYCGAYGTFVVARAYFRTIWLKFDCGTHGIADLKNDMTPGRATYWIKRSECAWKAGFYRVAEVTNTQQELFTR